MANRAGPHTALRRTIVKYLQWNGALVYGNLGGMGQTRGRADVTACLRGRYVDVEVKTGSGVQSAVQQEQMARVCQAGGIYIVARSVEDVEDVLLPLGLVTQRLFR